MQSSPCKALQFTTSCKAFILYMRKILYLSFVLDIREQKLIYLIKLKVLSCMSAPLRSSYICFCVKRSK